jgi:hypothetical protein
MQFDADAFISYAHVDNQELVEGRKGWVANLHRALEIRVGQLLGKHPQIWRDPKLQGNDVFPETLKDRLRHVAALIAVVSPRYIRSEWTLRELHEFCQAAQDQGGVQLRQKSRIFKVLKTPVPEPSHPPELRPLLGYEFFKRDPETGKVRELDDVFGESAQREFWMRLDDLAHELSALLSELGSGEDAGEKAAPFSVFLAETTSDLREQRETLRRDLQRHGYRILPAVPLPFVAADVASAIRADLAECRLSIHLFGSTYGLVPEGGAQSLLEQQNELAIERASGGSFCRLLWIPPNLTIADDRQRAVVDRLRNDPRLEEGADLLETYLEDFRTLVHERLEAAAAPKAEEAPPPAAAPSASDQRIRSVYAIYEQRDAGLAAPWVDHLFDQRLEVLNPVFDGDEAEVREYHEENIRTCDGVLIFYGSANEVWIRRKLRELQKSAGYGRLKAAPTVAICVLPPETPEKDRFRTHEASVIRSTGAFAADRLEPFLRELRSRPG